MRKNPADSILAASFRDPDGFLFKTDKVLYRQINSSYKNDYDALLQTGLYNEFTQKKMLVPHKEVNVKPPTKIKPYKILKPETIPFISYPYEWCFSQYKEAALLTLEIQKISLEKGLSLKDASAYNVQFYYGKPVFIDTLSFEKYPEGKPWIAYGQFCRHFLAPLLLMYYIKADCNKFMRIYLDGIPLDLASSLLPGKTKFRLSILSHIHLHATSSKRYAGKSNGNLQFKLSKNAMLGLIDNLESLIKSLTYNPVNTEWANYTLHNNYSKQSHEHKKNLVTKFLQHVQPQIVWDLGANTGTFSRIAAQMKAKVISWDVDPAAVERNYQDVRNKNEENVLPLMLDLTNPSPAQGWHLRERLSLTERGPADLVMALALIHHIAISNNVPLERIALFFQSIARYAVVEFVPKSDSQVKLLLSTRKDIFPEYTQENFEKVFSRYFKIMKTEKITESERTLYLLKSLSTKLS